MCSVGLYLFVALSHVVGVLCVSPPSVCSVPPGPVTLPENSTADVQLVQISSGGDVALRVTVNPEELFYLKGNALMVKKGVDYEVIKVTVLSNEPTLKLINVQKHSFPLDERMSSLAAEATVSQC